MSRTSVAALTVSLAIACGASGTLASGCADLEPEVGEKLTACVDADSNPAVTVSFKDQIRPIMSGQVPGPEPCAKCHYHSGGTMEGLRTGGLDLETLGLLRNGGRTSFGTIAIPGKPCESAIIQKLRGTYQGPRMPKAGPYWTPAQIQLMSDWIFEGAVGDSND